MSLTKGFVLQDRRDPLFLLVLDEIQKMASKAVVVSPGHRTQQPSSLWFQKYHFSLYPTLFPAQTGSRCFTWICQGGLTLCVPFPTVVVWVRWDSLMPVQTPHWCASGHANKILHAMATKGRYKRIAFFKYLSQKIARKTLPEIFCHIYG